MFDSASDFLPVAAAIFLPTAFDARHGFFSSRRCARHRAASLTAKRRGKCLSANRVSTAFASSPFVARPERMQLPGVDCSRSCLWPWSWPGCGRFAAGLAYRLAPWLAPDEATGFATSEAPRLAPELAFHEARRLASSEAANATLGATFHAASREAFRATGAKHRTPCPFKG
jgi:hypothetical protein